MKNGSMRFGWLSKFRSWWVGGKSIARSIFRVTAAKQGIIVIGMVLMGGYVASAFYTGAGEFVIRVDNAGEKKLVLSNTTDFSDELITLKGTPIREADNISIFNIDSKVADIEGEHNVINYIAYTFYIKNIGYEALTYNYELLVNRATKGIEDATWAMLYYNGKQQIFAKENKSGDAESQQSTFEFPFMEDARNPELYSYDESTGMHILTAEKFSSPTVVTAAQSVEIMPQATDKFTVVIWLEGEDPECVDNIMGGSIEMVMNFKY